MTPFERIIRRADDSDVRVLFVRSPEGSRWGVTIRRAGALTGVGYGQTLLSALYRASDNEREKEAKV